MTPFFVAAASFHICLFTIVPLRDSSPISHGRGRADKVKSDLSLSAGRRIAARCVRSKDGRLLLVDDRNLGCESLSA